MDRRGFVLPAAVLLLMVLTGMVFAGFLVAGAELRMTAAERSHVELLAKAPRPGAPLPVADELEVALFGGYVLLRLPVSGTASAWHRVAWRLDPALEAAAWVSPVEAGSDPLPASEAVVLEEGPCGWEPAEAPVRPLGLPGSPLLGPVTLTQLLARLADTGEPAFPVGGEPLLEGAGARVAGSPDGRLILAPERLRVIGPGTLRGLVLAEGDVELSAGAVLKGAVRSRGQVLLSEGTQVVGARCRVREALSLPPLAPAFPVPGGERLGRF